MTGAAGGRRYIDVENIEGGAPNGSGDALDFQDWVVVKSSGQMGVGDRVVDEEGKSPTGVAGAVLSQ